MSIYIDKRCPDKKTPTNLPVLWLPNCVTDISPFLGPTITHVLLGENYRGTIDPTLIPQSVTHLYIHQKNSSFAPRGYPFYLYDSSLSALDADHDDWLIEQPCYHHIPGGYSVWAQQVTVPSDNHD